MESKWRLNVPLLGLAWNAPLVPYAPHREILLAELTALPGMFLSNCQPYPGADLAYVMFQLLPGDWEIWPDPFHIDHTLSFPFGYNVEPDHHP